MKRIVSLFFFIALASYSSFLHPDSAPTSSTTLTTLSMEEAIEIAHKNKPSLQALEQRVYLSKVEERQAWAGYYPTVNLISNLRQQRGQSGPQALATLSANQLVYDFAGPQAQAKRARKKTESQRYFAQQLYNDVRLDVARTFLQCWRIQQQRAAIQALNISSQEMFDQARHEEKLNLLNKNVFLQNAETHAADLATVYSYHQDVEIFQRRLEFLMGQVVNLNIVPNKNSTLPTTKLVWQNEQETPLNDINFYYAIALNNHPEIKEQQKNIEVHQESEKIALNQHLPKFSVHALAGATNVLETGYHNYHNFGIAMNWDIFNLPHIDYQAKLARVQKLEATLQKQEIENRVRSEVATAYYSLAQEVSKLRAERFHYARAHNEFTLRSQELATGLISPVDLIIAQTTWKNAQIALIDQQVATETRRQELLHKCGYSEKIIV